MPDHSDPPRNLETVELRRLRKRIDALDRRLVAMLNERAELAREAGRAKRAAGRRAIRDAEREREVLLWVAQGKSNPEIAAILGAAENTIKVHLGRIFEKVGADNRHAAMLSALEILAKR